MSLKDKREEPIQSGVIGPSRLVFTWCRLHLFRLDEKKEEKEEKEEKRTKQKLVAGFLIYLERLESESATLLDHVVRIRQSKSWESTTVGYRNDVGQQLGRRQ